MNWKHATIRFLFISYAMVVELYINIAVIPLLSFYQIKNSNIQSFYFSIWFVIVSGGYFPIELMLDKASQFLGINEFFYNNN